MLRRCRRRGWTGQGRPGGRPSYPLEGQTGRDGGGVGGCSWGVCPEGLHVETKERVSSDVVYAGKVLCRECKVVCGSNEEKVA